MSDGNGFESLTAEALRQFMIREGLDGKGAAARLRVSETMISNALAGKKTELCPSRGADLLFNVSTESTGFTGSVGTLGAQNLDAGRIDATSPAHTGRLRDLAARETIPDLAAALDRADIAAELGERQHDAEAVADLPVLDEDTTVFRQVAEIERVRRSEK